MGAPQAISCSSIVSLKFTVFVWRFPHSVFSGIQFWPRMEQAFSFMDHAASFQRLYTIWKWFGRMLGHVPLSCALNILPLSCGPWVSSFCFRSLDILGGLAPGQTFLLTLFCGYIWIPLELWICPVLCIMEYSVSQTPFCQMCNGRIYY
ncbi:hypothetical protein NPIL_415941 [Nephila pilipes]|uniref:Uncharacterized protein n=1 Tax=Nephila pilipes TaxID=299642 RepID=A0A8X6UTG5_NEPPI|nr:hypothetical protein NPIL_415941 [Nephila pilipes]